MAETPPRRFNLGDALILIAALAVGLALARPALGDFHAGPVQDAVVRGLIYTTPQLLGCSFALTAMGLRRPRPPLKRLARRSGFSSCFAAAIGATLALLAILAYIMFSSAGSRFNNAPIIFRSGLYASLPNGGGYSSLAAMLVLTTQGRLRPHPSWMDRLAFALALAWVALALLSWARMILS
jgi:hypothetical protein